MVSDRLHIIQQRLFCQESGGEKKKEKGENKKYNKILN